MSARTKKSRDLLGVAKILLNSSRSRPKNEQLNRAVSSAYYAVFHRLCRLAADALIGASRSGDPDWVRIYRGVEHRNARKVFDKPLAEFNRAMKDAVKARRPAPIPTALQAVADIFLMLQEERHAADYDPTQRWTKSEVQSLINQAEQALAHLDALPDEQRRALAVDVIVAFR